MTAATLPEIRSPLAALAALCRASFRDFVRVFWSRVPGAGGRVSWNWHLDVLCDTLGEAAGHVRDRRPRPADLIFNVPFGTSKSTIISILFPAWVWTFQPGARFLTATHTDKLVRDLSAKSRAVIVSELYRDLFPGVNLVKDSEDYFRNNHGGDRNCCTVGGKTPTGFHADYLLIDDPIDPQGARSQVELDTAAYFVREVIPSRKTDKAVSLTVLIMQRLDYRDPTAVMEAVAREEGTVPVRKVCLPGELTDKAAPHLEELRARYGGHVYGEDGLLDPLRLPRAVLRDYQARLGLQGYSAQVLQDPRPPGGAMFKPQWFVQRVKAAPYHARRVRYIDRAATANGGCATAMTLMAKDDAGRRYVEHCAWGQWEPNERNDRIVAQARRDLDRYGPRNAPVYVIEAERGSTGLESYQAIARRVLTLGVRCREDQPTGSKDTRAEPWADQLAALNVWLVEDGTWDVSAYVEEHLLFKPGPGKRLGGFKDRVDSSSGADRWLTNLERPTGQFRILRSKGQVGPRLVVCSHEALLSVHAQQLAILIRFTDPEPYNTFQTEEAEPGRGDAEREVGHAGAAVIGHGVSRLDPSPSANDTNAGSAGCSVAGDPPPGALGLPHESPAGPRPHGLENLLEELVITCADLAPAEVQDSWDVVVPDYGRPAAELVLSREQGRKLWGVLTRRRPRQPELLVFVDSGDRRAFSAALAVCDVLRLPRSAVYLPAEPDRVVGDKEAAGNPHIYDQVKACRSLVL